MERSRWSSAGDGKPASTMAVSSGIRREEPGLKGMGLEISIRQE